MILSIRTDKPEAEISLLDGGKQIASAKWHAHHQLAETLHVKIKEQLDSVNKTWSDISGVVCYSGPGSFTGLRIGASVAQALCAGLKVLLASAGGTDWIVQAKARLNSQPNKGNIELDYGSPVKVTTPKG